jgi:hypothetical protein
VISCEFLGCQRTFTRRHIYKWVFPVPPMS